MHVNLPVHATKQSFPLSKFFSFGKVCVPRKHCSHPIRSQIDPRHSCRRKWLMYTTYSISHKWYHNLTKDHPTMRVYCQFHTIGNSNWHRKSADYLKAVLTPFRQICVCLLQAVMLFLGLGEGHWASKPVATVKESPTLWYHYDNVFDEWLLPISLL